MGKPRRHIFQVACVLREALYDASKAAREIADLIGIARGHNRVLYTARLVNDALCLIAQAAYAGRDSRSKQKQSQHDHQHDRENRIEKSLERLITEGAKPIHVLINHDRPEHFAIGENRMRGFEQSRLRVGQRTELGQRLALQRGVYVRAFASNTGVKLVEEIIAGLAEYLGVHGI